MRTVTALATICPASKLRLEPNCGRGALEGQSWRNEGAVALTTVTLRTTAAASGGTPPWPATLMSRVVPDPHGEAYGPMFVPPERESRMRAGSIGWKRVVRSANATPHVVPSE